MSEHSRAATTADAVARAIFSGRAAIWGAVAPLGCLVIAWSAVLILGDADAAVALASTWAGWFALWLLALVLALVARFAFRFIIAARRHERRMADMHSAIAEHLGRKVRPPKDKSNPVALAAAAIAAIVITMSLAAPAVTCGGSDRALDFLGACVLAMAIALVAKLADNENVRSESLRRCALRKTARRARQEADTKPGTEGWE